MASIPSVTGPCQAEDSDGEECDCEEFAPKSLQPKVCRRCLHARRHHPETLDTISSILLKVKAEHEPAPTSKFSQAKRESLNGMRPRSKDTKTAGKGKAKAKASKEPPSVAVFKVDTIIILADGIAKKLILEDDLIPSKADIQILVNKRLAIRKDNGIEIPVSAAHEDVIDLFSELLSGPMGYFDSIGHTVFTDPVSGLEIFAPPWVLLTRVRQHLRVVHVVNPTGRDLNTHRGGRHGTESRYIFISSREPIPEEDLALWRTLDSKKGRKTSGGSGKRLSSIAFGDSDEESEDRSPANKKPVAKKHQGSGFQSPQHFYGFYRTGTQLWHSWPIASFRESYPDEYCYSRK
ncbi:hypothetical protein DFH09DRAFT_1300971 [Mycena vulgaris]|nr:hypothetical protein DFH09DRAFT_1300971 [Mycena vulgaris]